MDQETETTFDLGDILAAEVEQRAAAVEQVLEDLDEGAIWERLAPGSNAVGNLVLHLCGNLRNYIVKGVGERPFTRDRPQEFAETGILRAELRETFRRVISEVLLVLREAQPRDFEMPHKLVEFPSRPKAALAIHSVEHLGYHTGQLVLMAKILRKAPTCGMDQ